MIHKHVVFLISSVVVTDWEFIAGCDHCGLTATVGPVMKLATEVATFDPQSSHPSLLASIRLPDLDLSLRNINCAGSCLFFPHAAMVHPASAQMKFSNEVLLIGSRQTRWRPSHLTHVITRLLVLRWELAWLHMNEL